LAGGLQGWFIVRDNLFERLILVISGVALAYPSFEADIVGIVGFALCNCFAVIPQETPGANLSKLLPNEWKTSKVLKD
jgi:TRAP-type uncharacterized transport system fused permease subunit